MADEKITNLLMVYDADSGKWGAFVDSAKKLLMIKGCALCSLTHGLNGEREAWKECKDELGVPVDYVHRDEIDSRLDAVVNGELPCIVAETGDGSLRLVMPRGVLERCRGSFADFRGKLQYHVSAQGLRLAS